MLNYCKKILALLNFFVYTTTNMKIDFDPKKHIANLVTDEDGEVRELTAEDFKQFRPAAEVLPELFGAGLAADMLRPKKRRQARAPIRPKSLPPRL